MSRRPRLRPSALPARASFYDSSDSTTRVILRLGTANKGGDVPCEAPCGMTNAEWV